MKLLLGFICLTSALAGFGQKVIDVSNNTSVGSDLFFTVGGEPFVTAKFVRLVEGTPYFKDEWLKATIVMPAGKEYKNISVKLDLFDHELHYRDNKDVEMIANVALKEVVIADAVNTYRFVHSSSIPLTVSAAKKGFYQLLFTGKASLYKYFNKSLSENKPYGSATTEQKIRTTEVFMVHYNNALLEIKKIKDAASVLANKAKEVEEFLKNKDDKNLSMEDRMIALVEYYNSLLTE